MVECRGWCQTFFLHLPPDMDGSTVDFRVVLFNRDFPERSVVARKNRWSWRRKRRPLDSKRPLTFIFAHHRDWLCIGKQGRGWQIKIPTFSFRQSFEEDDRGFLRNGWLSFGLRILISRPPPDFIGKIRLFEEPRVSIEVITDSRIREQVKQDGLSSMFKIPRSKMYILPASETLDTVSDMVSSSPVVYSVMDNVLRRLKEIPNLVRFGPLCGCAPLVETAFFLAPSA